MSRREEITSQIEGCGVVAIIRIKEPRQLRGVVDALAEGGVRAIEITMSVPRAVELIAEIRPTLPAEFVLGAGTILDAAHELDVAVMPGCFTPTEILTAWDGGADVIKVFPATALGPAFLKDVRAPLPQVKLMPTGGV